MKEQYIRDLSEGSRVDCPFALRSRDIRSARTGEPYLALEVADCTGRLPAVMFRPGSLDESLPIGSVVRVRGLVTTFRGVRRVTVDSLEPTDGFDPRDFLAAGTRDRDELVAELRGLVRRVKDQRVRAVVRAIFGAPGFIDRFSSCPASVGRHHAYVGGLLEHTVSVANLCLALTAAYPQADGDVLLAAALLHDVGKVDELSADTSIGLTDAGHLVGHVVLGERLLSAAIRDAARPLPEQTALRLMHAVLAHHGEREWGAPKCPCTLEALLLHHADHTDAQAAAFMEAVSGAAVLEQPWSDRSNSFGRALMVPVSSAPPVPTAVVAAAGVSSQASLGRACA
jgi:3'-5' exoribonuclease